MDLFAAVCINTTTKRYKFKNGSGLATSDTTLDQMNKSGDIALHLRSTVPIFEWCTFLGNFACVEGKTTTEKLANFVISSNSKINWKMNCIILYVVDSAVNQVVRNDKMKVSKKDDRPIDVSMC